MIYPGVFICTVLYDIRTWYTHAKLELQILQMHQLSAVSSTCNYNAVYMRSASCVLVIVVYCRLSEVVVAGPEATIRVISMHDIIPGTVQYKTHERCGMAVKSKKA